MPALLSYWRDLATRYVTSLCALPEIGEGGQAGRSVPADDLARIGRGGAAHDRRRVPDRGVLADLWRGMDLAFDAELAEAKVPVQDFLKCRHPAWNLVGRVHFNLAENRKDEEAPFAFLATYTTRFRRRPRRSICLSARLCRNMPAPRTASACCRF